jgi:hypothetical protein
MITKRILKYIEIKGITKYKFCKDLGFSNGFLDKPREITTDKYAKILEYFPELNPQWLLTEEGSMLKKGENPPVPVMDKNALEMIKELSAENALLWKENEELKKEKKDTKTPLAVLDAKYELKRNK